MNLTQVDLPTLIAQLGAAAYIVMALRAQVSELGRDVADLRQRLDAYIAANEARAVRAAPGGSNTRRSSGNGGLKSVDSA